MRHPTTAVAPAVVVRESSRHGRGVFAARTLSRGELLDNSPALLLGESEGARVMHTSLREYVFYVEGRYAIVCGPTTFCNHSYDPNARYVVDVDGEAIELHARRDIAAGEEILINYNGDPADRARLWFDVEV